jgi:hypothetical protein
VDENEHAVQTAAPKLSFFPSAHQMQTKEARSLPRSILTIPFVLLTGMDGEPYVVPQLFDISIDQKHISYYVAVKGEHISDIKARVSNTFLPLHPKFAPRLV